MTIIAKIARILVANVLIMSSIIAYSQTFEVVNSKRSDLELSLRIDKFSLEDSMHEGIEGQTIILDGIFLPGKAGMPDLPVISRYVAIPRGADVM